jgi:hypothetical protein
MFTESLGELAGLFRMFFHRDRFFYLGNGFECNRLSEVDFLAVVFIQSRDVPYLTALTPRC